MIEQLPVLPLRSLTIFPNTSISIDVSRDLCVNAIKHAVDNKLKIVACLQIDSECVSPMPDDLFSIGTLCDINKILKIDESTYRILVDGLCAVDLMQFIPNNDFLIANVEERTNTGTMTEIDFIANKTFILRTLETLTQKYEKMFPKHIRTSLENCNEAGLLANLSAGLVSSPKHKQKLLSERDINKKFELICDMLSEDLSYLDAMYNIEKKVHDKISNSNKEFVLREQIKSIQEELGEGEDDVYVEYCNKIESLNADDGIKSKLKKDLDRYNRMNESAPESAIIRNYLDWALELPWNNTTEDSSDMSAVIAQLNKDHYGIEKVKKRIVEYLAVRHMTNGSSKGAVLCLVGPPGVGKTSICKSIATALNKEFVQLTLGGVHDEAEIRGHRKTYIGAMPGRILSNLAKSQSNNPLFLLDEVDKITRDMRGDPSAALLEVLDPNQNKTFRDNYLELPYDLSNVMFVLTANDLQNLDKPLLDRLEVIEMEGYTLEEKIAIATQYLVPKQAKEHGLDIEKLTITKNAIIEIIEGYTRESGVRELERQIATVCRKIAYDIVIKSNGDTSKMVHNKKVIITPKRVGNMLGVRIFSEKERSVEGAVGKVVGLAWTIFGGETLDIEVCIMQGKGELKLTGKLGEVMKESAMIAISVVRSRSEQFGIDEKFFETHDIHIHVPKGATPKDGPSAGITITTAVLSAILGKKVKDKLAMTGEISLNGDALAIGGVKEKSLAAHRIGIKTIIIPRQNEKDIIDLPDSVKKDINFVLVDKIEQVWQQAIEF